MRVPVSKLKGASRATFSLVALMDNLANGFPHDAPDDVDQGIEMNGKADIVPQQVLRIVYLADKAGVTRGGLFPKRMGGALRSTQTNRGIDLVTRARGER